MKTWMTVVTAISLLLSSCPSRADFKYTENTKITGGAVAGLMKFASRVSGKAGVPESSTYYIKGNRMRVEGSDGEAQIIDLDAHHIVGINTKKKTYTIVTFAEMQEQMERLRQAGSRSKQDGQINISPKVKVTPTQNTRVILGQTVHEIQARVELQMNDPDEAGENATTTLVTDMWVTPSVHGYEEVRSFFQRMAREAAWAPRGGIASDPRMSQAMDQMRKSSPLLNGFPLLASVKMSGSTAATNRSGRRKNDAGSDGAEIPTSVPTSKGDAINSALGGLVGLHRRKKESQKQDSASEGSSAGGDDALMTATTEVTSFSDSALDSSLFEIPAGFRQVQSK